MSKRNTKKSTERWVQPIIVKRTHVALNRGGQRHLTRWSKTTHWFFLKDPTKRQTLNHS
jgi:hypothetical protein